MDKVIAPDYYKSSDNKFEVIDIIEQYGLDFCLGNAVKYICRAGKKHEKVAEDLQKAIWYLERKIEQLELNK